jgi:hypothetical protein
MLTINVCKSMWYYRTHVHILRDCPNRSWNILYCESNTKKVVIPKNNNRQQLTQLRVASEQNLFHLLIYIYIMVSGYQLQKTRIHRERWQQKWNGYKLKIQFMLMRHNLKWTSLTHLCPVWRGSISLMHSSPKL